MINLPFTTDQFLGIFRSYNNAVWPFQIVLLLLALLAIFIAIKSTSRSSRIVSGILAFFWLWMGIAYHLLAFSAINKAAYIFALLCVTQGFFFFFLGVIKQKLSFRFRFDWFGITGAILLLYALVIYPALGYLLGHPFPQSPTFGLPCPTTIFTFALLLWTDRGVPPVIVVIPVLWSLIGSSAALSLGMKEDIGLLFAGLVGTLLIYVKNVVQRNQSVRNIA